LTAAKAFMLKAAPIVNRTILENLIFTFLDKITIL
jgi:hypothetical protein